MCQLVWELTGFSTLCLRKMMNGGCLSPGLKREVGSWLPHQALSARCFPYLCSVAFTPRFTPSVMRAAWGHVATVLPTGGIGFLTCRCVHSALHTCCRAGMAVPFFAHHRTKEEPGAPTGEGLCHLKLSSAVQPASSNHRRRWAFVVVLG